jgi:hypothetical protein
VGLCGCVECANAAGRCLALGHTSLFFFSGLCCVLRSEILISITNFLLPLNETNTCPDTSS